MSQKTHTINQRKDRPPVFLLMGPTASGKTDLVLALSEVLPLDIISVDSAMVYRGMDIGTAKPDQETLGRYPHALIDIVDPSEPYSAARFVKDAQQLIKTSHNAGRIPILVGGTMLYFKALIDGFAEMPPTDYAYREELSARADALGWPALHKELGQVDPATAAKLHPNHSVRIERALQIYKATGVPMSEYHARQETSDFADRFSLTQIAIAPQQRHLLHERIQQRLDHMFESGFVQEVEQLYQRGDLHPELPSIRAVGYRQLWSYFAGEIGLDEAKQKTLFATRKLAKRQLTWMRSWRDLKLLYTEDSQSVRLADQQIISKCLKLLGLEPSKA